MLKIGQGLEGHSFIGYAYFLLCTLCIPVCKLQKVNGRQPISAGIAVSEMVSQTSVTSPGPSFAMLQKLVEETDSKFIVTHEEVCAIFFYL